TKSATPVVADLRQAEVLPGQLESLTPQIEGLDGFDQVLASLTAGHSATLGGVWGSSCALVAATLARHCPGVLVLVAPRPATMDTLLEDTRLFTLRELAPFGAAETSATSRIFDQVGSERLR